MRLVRQTIFAIVAMAHLPGSAQAQQITAEGAARAASAQAAIVQFCAPFYPLNGPKAAALSAASRDVALGMYTRAKGQAEVDREFKRRFNEVNSTGPRFWCQYQREVQKNLNSGVFLD